MDELLRATGICKHYVLGDTHIEVLKGVDLGVVRGEIVAVVGASGVGKSTLLHILGGLDHPVSGTVVIDGVDIFALSDTDRAKFRNRQIGFVFQFHHLLRDFTALENVMMPLMIAGVSSDEARVPAQKLLCDVGLEQRLAHLPSELSGGEAQRVAVARALVTQPAVVSGRRTFWQSRRGAQCRASRIDLGPRQNPKPNVHYRNTRPASGRSR